MAAKSVEPEKVDFIHGVLEKNYHTPPITFEQHLRHLQLRNEYGLIRIYTIGVLTIIAVLLGLWLIGNAGGFLSAGSSQKAILAIQDETQMALAERAQKLISATQEDYLNRVSRIVTFFLTPLLSILTLLIGYVMGHKRAEAHASDSSGDDS
jgi:hypothetical protein